HGIGSNEQDLMALAPEIHPELVMVTYRAPLLRSEGGYAWFEILWNERDGIVADQSQALLSRDLLIEELGLLRDELGLPQAKVLIGGFSQGAIMSLGVALKSPELIEGAILM